VLVLVSVMAKLGRRREVVVHQADGDFKHVITQGEVAEAVPGARSALTHAALGVAEVSLCVFVEARHSKVLRA
jgi:hypothetical protein